MFEATQAESQSSSKGPWMVIFLVVALVVGGGLLYVMSRKDAVKALSPASAPAAANVAAPAGNADPVHDLKIHAATMEKDRTGTTAVWLVTIENKSSAYTYTAIKYETSYIGADNTPVLVNQGTLADRIAPGEEIKSEFRDALYPAGTAWYKFRITGATPAVE
jgi:hypothetical protein